MAPAGLGVVWIDQPEAAKAVRLRFVAVPVTGAARAGVVVWGGMAFLR